MVNKMLLLLAITASSIFPGKAFAIDVTYISQTRVITPYWSNVYAVVQAAARDLNINLTIIEGQGHRIYQAEVIATLVGATKKPDLLIFHAYKQNAAQYFNLLEQAKIPFVTYSNFTDPKALPADRQLGHPQGKYKYWLSEHYVANFQGAALLVKSLINQAKTSQPQRQKPLRVLALSGDLIMQSLERSAGIAAQIKLEDNVILVQDIVVNWSREEAKNKFKALFSRHNGIDLVWASSDVMALGALTGAIELGLRPNKDIFIGGFDWDAKAIAKIKQHQLSASAGGQFYNIAWLLVQVYDHFNNQAAFPSQNKQMAAQYTVIEQSNLAQFEQLTTMEILTSVNFYCFTKTYTRQTSYDFSMSNLLKQSSSPDKQHCQ
ncbi:MULTISPECIES: ABC transporter substrate-binding protein [Colwellia]|uniref:Sugar ABC transporter substrate-binding protein n=1 Tax=Colwellia marinimaniae TaxID=1513592 RepID=A0ABQ0MQ43_9GAMM|nr:MULTISPECIES: ABC transporter substrate-binding protein [Colwellia]GAW94491.1 sugar ABC transporter substrate-binding protein [Colwellia marinimaniae]